MVSVSKYDEIDFAGFKINNTVYFSCSSTEGKIMSWLMTSLTDWKMICSWPRSWGQNRFNRGENLGRCQGHKSRFATTRSNVSEGCARNAEEETCWNKKILWWQNKLLGGNGHPLTRGMLHNHRWYPEKNSHNSNHHQRLLQHPSPSGLCTSPNLASPSTELSTTLSAPHSCMRTISPSQVTLTSNPFTASVRHPWHLSSWSRRREWWWGVIKMMGSNVGTSQAVLFRNWGIYHHLPNSTTANDLLSSLH